MLTADPGADGPPASDGQPVPGAFVDFGLYLFHNAAELKSRGTGPYFYLPKLESHLEARLWSRVFNFAEDRLGLARGTAKALGHHIKFR